MTQAQPANTSEANVSETNGHAVRSNETKARMIEAAIEVFGALG